MSKLKLRKRFRETEEEQGVSTSGGYPLQGVPSLGVAGQQQQQVHQQQQNDDALRMSKKRRLLMSAESPLTLSSESVESLSPSLLSSSQSQQQQQFKTKSGNLFDKNDDALTRLRRLASEDDRVVDIDSEMTGDNVDSNMHRLDELGRDDDIELLADDDDDDDDDIVDVISLEDDNEESVRRAAENLAQEEERRKKAKKRRGGAHVTLYCICRGVDDGRFMIGCDKCGEWFHGSCVGMSAARGERLKKWLCADCRELAEDMAAMPKAPSTPTKKRRTKPKASTPKRRTSTPTRRGAAAKKRKAAATTPRIVYKRVSLLGTTKAIQSLAEAAGSTVCLHGECANTAQRGSKFCSELCGARAARALVERRQNHREHVEELARARAHVEQLRAAATGGGGDVAELGQIDAFERKMAIVRENIELLAARRADLARHMERIAALDPSSPTDNTATTTTTVEDEVKREAQIQRAAMSEMDCAACGKQVPSYDFSRHIASCYARAQDKDGIAFFGTQVAAGVNAAHGLAYCGVFDAKTRSYCERLRGSCARHQAKPTEPKKNGYCGCPTDRFSSGFCQQLRKRCVKHVGWQRLLVAQCEQDVAKQQQLNKQFQEQIDHLHIRSFHKNQWQQ
jgi:CpG binding protein C-terminal domain/PHD-finger